MKYRLTAEHLGEHRVEKMAANMEVTRSGFHAWLRWGKSPRREVDEQLQEVIKGVQQEVKYRILAYYQALLKGAMLLSAVLLDNFARERSEAA
jgi:hypothetical protein